MQGSHFGVEGSGKGKGTNLALLGACRARRGTVVARVPSFGFHGLVSWFGVSDFGLRISVPGFRVRCFGFCGFHESGFRSRVAVFGFGVSGFGFRIPGLGFRVSDFETNLKGGSSFRDSGVPFIANAVLEENASLRGSGLVLRARSTRPGSCERVRSSR